MLLYQGRELEMEPIREKKPFSKQLQEAVSQLYEKLSFPAVRFYWCSHFQVRNLLFLISICVSITFFVSYVKQIIMKNSKHCFISHVLNRQDSGGNLFEHRSSLPNLHKNEFQQLITNPLLLYEG